jgi:hypothetical protein
MKATLQVFEVKHFILASSQIVEWKAVNLS